MCGIACVLSLDRAPLPGVRSELALMNRLQAHRGPDGEGTWVGADERVGLGHRRLSIIDLETGQQPMTDEAGRAISYNGEVYNYVELRAELGRDRFRTSSDTEAILRAYERWGDAALDRLRGMFAFALWDEPEQRLVCARDRFGIKPLYWSVVDGVLRVASEAKALVPFLERIETDPEGLKDYLVFQLCLDGKTLFAGIRELPPGHVLVAERGQVSVRRWWDVTYEPDFAHTERWFAEELRALLDDSISMHLRSDVPLGAYLSGGLDSSVVATLAASSYGGGMQAFTGLFDAGPAYDESRYAREVASQAGLELREVAIDAEDFVRELPNVVYHLDFPVAGPGAFPQYLVSRLAAEHVKVVLGGQGGDEIFGGYARYLIAYFEQCIKAAIEGTMHAGNFVVTYESIIPSLSSLREYKPLLQHFWRDGLFEDMDRRYFRLVNRGPALREAIDWDGLEEYSAFQTFRGIFHAGNVGKESYFDLMTHFDFKTLLPGLLQVEDRVSMAHGLESRVPLIDHRIVELAATMPANVKFPEGQLKHALRAAAGDVLPASVLARTDKMGFPVPLHEWTHGPLFDFVVDAFAGAGLERPYLRESFDPRTLISRERQFGRSLWGLLCLELWQQRFHDRAGEWRALVEAPAAAASGS